MKKLIYILGIVAAVAACTVEEMDQPVIESGYRASFETKDTKDTKVYVDIGLNMHWNSGDKIGLFEAGTLLQQYVFDGATGDTEGSFLKKSGSAGGSSLDAVYAVYPYSDALEINTNGDISLSLPGVQKYAVNSFGLGANTCIAVTPNPRDKNLVFKNLCGYVVVNLYGDGKVSKVTLKGNNGEVLAGNATVWTSMTASAITSLDGAKEIILECGDQGVELGSSADKATAFWFVVPPVTFSKGLTVEVLKSDGTSFSKTTTTSRTVVRNKVYRMTASEAQDPFFGEVRSLKYTASSQLDAGYDIKIKSDGTVQATDNFSKYEVGQQFCGSVIAEHKFDYIAGQGEIVFSKPITEIEDGAFYGCNTLTGNISIPDGITSIGDYAFYKCNNLDGTLKVPYSTITIGKYAFAETSSLTGYSFERSYSVISEGLFENSGLDNAPDLSGCEIIGDYAFNGCDFDYPLVIPDSVISIGKGAFANSCRDQWGRLSLTIGKNVREIGDYAFYGCYGFSCTVTLPKTLESIGDYAFYNAGDFHDFTIPDNVKSIGKFSFFYVGFKVLTIGSGLTEIPEGAFKECFIEGVVLGDNIVSIGDDAFSDCMKLSGNLILPSGLKSIGNHAFMNCRNLSGTLTLPDSVRNIGTAAFYGCYGFNGNLSLNNGLESIGVNAFRGCQFKGALVIPDSVTYLGGGAFQNCCYFTGSLKIGKGLTSIEPYTFNNCVGFNGALIINDNITSIGEGAFDSCRGFTHSLVIPDSVTSIGDCAFRDCRNFEPSIRLSKSLKSVGAEAFDCESVSEVYCPAVEVPAIRSNAFWGLASGYLIYVPEESYQKYMADPAWSSISKHIVAYDFSE